MKVDLKDILTYLQQLQKSICLSLEIIDGNAIFADDEWQRAEGGGGLSKVIENGNIFEKGGVNFSHVFGKLPDILKSETRNADYFHATGVSIVIHPVNPFVPIIHMNVRYFCMSEHEGSAIVDEWFGGGIDVSPAYPNETDILHLHSTLKSACDKFDTSYYPAFKKWCDEYFTIKHRNEMRGVGGIFFDHLRPKDEEDKTRLFNFLQAIGNSFIPIYADIVNRNKHKAFTEKNKQWQYIRRGRYAEFNLVYDRGTHFGLKTNGRIESILMSLPPHAEWKYNFIPEKNSEEEKAISFFQPIDWKI
jgi:coproporphyrinogen III oxidase